MRRVLDRKAERRHAIAHGVGAGPILRSARLGAKGHERLDSLGRIAARVSSELGGKIDDLELTASERVVIDAKSSGEIDATITTPLLRADLTSSADGEIVHNGAQGVFNLGSSAELTISGKVGEVTVTTSSASGFHGENYTIDKATLKASSTSRITVGDVQTLSAQASSAAGIRYKGDPKITSLDTSSAGSIKKLD